MDAEGKNRHHEKATAATADEIKFSKREGSLLPYRRHTQSDTEGQCAWMLLSRPRGSWGYSVFLPLIGCPCEAPRCPEKCNAFKIRQSSGYGSMETAARLCFCTAIQGLTSRQVLMLSVPLATQHDRMVNFPLSRVTSGTRS